MREHSYRIHRVENYTSDAEKLRRGCPFQLTRAPHLGMSLASQGPPTALPAPRSHSPAGHRQPRLSHPSALVHVAGVGGQAWEQGCPGAPKKGSPALPSSSAKRPQGTCTNVRLPSRSQHEVGLPP